MISIFNRKELLITYDMKKQSEVRTILKNNEIEYKVKVKNILSPTSLNSNPFVTCIKVGFMIPFFCNKTKITLIIPAKVATITIINS